MRTFGLSEAEQAEVWTRWRQGESLRSIARGLGKHAPALRNLVAFTGGCRPVPRRRASRWLTVNEREEISRGLAAGESFHRIALRLDRAPSTVSREVARNGGRRRYRAQAADRAALERARRPKPAKLAVDQRLRNEVEARLATRWSPEQIAAWLRREYPDEPAMRVSHETIYLSLYVARRRALRRELARNLRSGRSIRRPRARRRPTGRGQLRDTISIRERPAEAQSRLVAGHWEGDLVLGRRPSGMVTLIERTSRYLMLLALPEGHRADKVRAALTAGIALLPDAIWRSLTWDQGKEMAEHLAFSAETGVGVYFCDPRSPWQRGSSENANGLVRQYYPSRHDLSGLTQHDLDAVAAELNARPRRVLGWLTPAERLAQLLTKATQ